MFRTRKEAKANNEPFYFTGKECKNGHISERYTSHGACKTCMANYFANLSDIQKAKSKYHAAKDCAEFRNIPWNFTFDTWYQWWQDTGHWHERGSRKNQYVMSRHNDVGPYSVENVFCQTQSANAREGHLGKPERIDHKSRLPETIEKSKATRAANRLKKLSA